jgi:quercetin dioxygenase-like cupin family protein
MTVALVRFSPGARTAWHSHARGQYLRVTQGVARFGDRDGNIIELRPGQTLYTSTATRVVGSTSWMRLATQRQR